MAYDSSVISATNSSTIYSPEGSTRTPVQTLDQGDFLNLLIAQMSQQDPMNPQKDTEFIAQMAQFSALEQSKSMQQDMAALRANTLLGNYVTVRDDIKATGTNTGLVESVEIKDGVANLIVNDGKESNHYLLSDVRQIYPPNFTTPTPIPDQSDPSAQ
jgi:flagellar basal-body rod modification protein FlgD